MEDNLTWQREDGTTKVFQFIDGRVNELESFSYSTGNARITPFGSGAAWTDRVSSTYYAVPHYSKDVGTIASLSGIGNTSSMDGGVGGSLAISAYSFFGEGTRDIFLVSESAPSIKLPALTLTFPSLTQIELQSRAYAISYVAAQHYQNGNQ